MRDGLALPGWPRALREELAAAYVGLSTSTFRAKVAPELKTVHLTEKRRAWLREDLDAWLDARAGIEPASHGANPWDSVL
jgi:predicted DNA-binding transcriptional regulator AlpA